MFADEKDHVEAFADTLGGRIVYAREAAELTTSQCARRLGVKSATLQGWESDRAEPRPNQLLTMAGMLNVSPTWLLTGAGESPIDTLDETEMMHIRGVVERLRDQALTIVQELEQLEKRLAMYQSYEP
jgi:transcriptional regulator with XRE-family HTH domain